MIHRDIKPSNLMLDPGGRLVLLDFGLVKDETEETMTGSGERLGTLRYMSPEQVLREKVDRRADVWALGATLYELLMLEPAFEGENEFAIERAITEDEPVRPRRLNRHLGTDLENIVLKALEKSPERRYQNAGELAADLSRFLRYDPVLARPPGLVRRATKAVVRHRVISSAAAVAVVGIVAFTFWLWIEPGLRLRDSLSELAAVLSQSESSENSIKLDLLKQAEDKLAALREEHGDGEYLDDPAHRIFNGFMSLGRAHRAQLGRIESTQASLDEVWRQSIPDQPWLPEWYRSDELIAYRQVHDAEKGKEVEHEYNVQKDQTAKLQKSVQDLENKIRQTRQKRTLLLARMARADSTTRINHAIDRAGNRSAFAQFHRLEEKVERREAKCEAYDRLEGRDVDAEEINEKFRNEEARERVEQELGELRARLNEPTTDSDAKE